MRRFKGLQNDEGATLLFALIFMGVVALLVTTLASLAANDLLNTSNIRGSRSSEYAADAATEVAIQNVRYRAAYYPTAAVCTPTGTASVSADGKGIEVYCNGTLTPSSAATRVVTFKACPAGQSANSCLTSPILQAVVTYDDYGANGFRLCTTSQSVTCGLGMTINSWTVYSGGNSVLVNPPPGGPSVATTSLPAGNQGQAYSQTLTSSGGVSPVTWSISAGVLPSGLSLASSTGVISGTIGNTATSQTFTVTVTDSNGATGSKSLTITVNPAGTAPAFVNASPPTTATVGTAYSYTFTASGNPAPSFVLNTGSLPAGLTLNSATGVLSGTPTTAGASTFTISAANGVGNPAITPNITITVSSGATKFVFTSSPVSGTVSTTATLGSITVQERDASNNPVLAGTGGTVVNLASNSSGGVFAATSGGVTITSITIPNGSSSVSFYYGDSKAGSPTITASGSLTSATQVETLAGGPAKQLQLAGCTVNGVAVTCASTFNVGNNGKVTATVQALDQFGNAATITSAISLSVTSSNTSTYQVTSGSSLTINGLASPPNQSTAAFTVTKQGTANNSASITVSGTGLTSLVFTVSK